LAASERPKFQFSKPDWLLACHRVPFDVAIIRMGGRVRRITHPLVTVTICPRGTDCYFLAVLFNVDICSMVERHRKKRRCVAFVICTVFRVERAGNTPVVRDLVLDVVLPVIRGKEKLRVNVRVFRCRRTFRVAKF